MGVFAQVRRKRSALVGASILTVSAVAITTMALAYDGYPTVEADLNDGGVWLTKTSSLLVGHFNHQSAVLDGGLRTKGDDYDIAQAGRGPGGGDRTPSSSRQAGPGDTAAGQVPGSGATRW